MSDIPTALRPGPPGTCFHCGRALRPCPHGLACRGMTPYGTGPCPDCRHHLVCRVHGRHWTGA